MRHSYTVAECKILSKKAGSELFLAPGQYATTSTNVSVHEHLDGPPNPWLSVRRRPYPSTVHGIFEHKAKGDVFV